MRKVQQLAEIAYENLSVGVNNQVFTNPDAPWWVWDLVRKIHDIDEQLPNDWVYQKTKEILFCFMNGEEPDITPDIYHYELLEWLKSAPHWGRVDEILHDFPGELSSLSNAIRAAQARKIEEMAAVIRDYLEELEEGSQE